jgi:hypothetical protein
MPHGGPLLLSKAHRVLLRVCAMDNRFFEQPILNSPYESPARHWELDAQGRPTQQISAKRRSAEFITPIPKPRKRKGAGDQQQMVFDEGKGLSTQRRQYDPTPIINELRSHVDRWRSIPNPSNWQVTPETARLLQHWRHHQFTGWAPGVSNLGSYGRWAFVEFTEVYRIESEFEKKVGAEFNKMIESIARNED